MKLSALLERLKEHKIAEVESVDDSGDYIAYTLHGYLPEFPHGRRPAWYTLVVEKGQEDIPEEDIEAIKRRFWQLLRDFE